MNIPLLVEMVAEAVPDRIVIGTRERGWSAAELLASMEAGASSLLARGAQRVGFLGLNSPAFALTLLASARAGLPFAPLNYRLTDHALHNVLERLAPAVVVADDDMLERASGVDGIDRISTREFLETTPTSAEEVQPQLPFLEGDEVAVLLFTSGTTGDPKTAVLRHRHLASYVLNTVEFIGAGEQEAQLVSVPAYHIAGVASVLSSLFAGRRVVYLPAFDPSEWVNLARTEEVTQAMVVPTMLDRILGVTEGDGAGLPSLRHLSYGGGRAPVELVERAMRVLPGVDLVNAYGLTETSSTIAALTPRDHRDCVGSDDSSARRRLGSVGRPLPTVELEIRDADGKVLGPGERGEIFVRGEQVAGEYATGSLLDDGGWFATKDAGWLDEEGFLFLDGRLDDVIVRGAENLSPGEIEDVLAQHPSVAEAAVVGIPDEQWGEAVAAAVVLLPGASASVEDLKEWVRARLRSTKMPELIQIREEMPYNETGKLLRRVIREDLSQLPAG
ncbi:MAG TPA: AMP-binding protein [Acidimicrobiales bacterium]|nr:AMP-binding protein [Acidimicrobiales bacterium]